MGHAGPLEDAVAIRIVLDDRACDKERIASAERRGYALSVHANRHAEPECSLCSYFYDDGLFDMSADEADALLEVPDAK
jgi:hypothetical protein